VCSKECGRIKENITGNFRTWVMRSEVEDDWRRDRGAEVAKCECAIVRSSVNVT
jgi:hypothetical protein